MTLPEEVERAAEALLAAMRKTEAFETYAALRRQVMADEVSRRLLSRFTRAESAPAHGRRRGRGAARGGRGRI